MNILDALIILIVLVQSAWWTKAGFTQGFFSLVSFWVGFIGGAALAPHALTLTDDPLLRILTAVAVIFGLAFVAGSLGQIIGVRLSGIAKKLRLGIADGILGAGFGAMVTLVIIWLLAAIISGSPFREVNREIRNSTVLQTMNQVLPDAPALISGIAALINPDGFPQVFLGPEPRPVEPVEQPSTKEVAAAIEAAGVSTVRLEGTGCDGIVTGSGFVAAPDMVVTNAHVVAGIRSLSVVDTNGQRQAGVIYFDADKDIAIVKTTNLAGKPLRIRETTQNRGTGTVALGYPGGGRLSGTPAAILRQIDARGLNIYGKKAVTRSMYELQAEVVSGNSGGPVVLPDGTVAGLVFARSESERKIGYALTSPEILAALETAKSSPELVTTGSCAPR